MIGKKERDFSLDVLRVLACFLVILLHVGVFYYQTKDDSNHVVIVRDSSAYVVGYMVSWCRTSVPLFFLMSGYLLLPVKMSFAISSTVVFPEYCIRFCFGAWRMPWAML